MCLAGSVSAELFLLHYTVLYGLKTFDAFLTLGYNFRSYKVCFMYIVLCFLVSIRTRFSQVTQIG